MTDVFVATAALMMILMVSGLQTAVFVATATLTTILEASRLQTNVVR
jgi:hypothetical protein